MADRLNSLPKYVVSSTLEDPGWNNSTVLTGDVVDEVSKLKQELDGEIVVLASPQLARTLIEHDLVDELRLMVFPVVLGAGERLFGETSDKKPMRLVDTQTVGDGLAYPHLRARPEAERRRTAPALQDKRAAALPGWHPGERLGSSRRQPADQLTVAHGGRTVERLALRAVHDAVLASLVGALVAAAPAAAAVRYVEPGGATAAATACRPTRRASGSPATSNTRSRP